MPYIPKKRIKVKTLEQLDKLKLKDLPELHPARPPLQVYDDYVCDVHCNEFPLCACGVLSSDEQPF
jgi:hypothetical protein